MSLCSLAIGQQFDVPAAPRFPVETDSILLPESNQPSPLTLQPALNAVVDPLEELPLPAEPVPLRTVQPDPTFADSEPETALSETPSESELVSILKRNMPSENETIEMKDAPEWFQNMMQRIVRDNIPDKYVQDKDWGKTEKRWDGLQLRRRGFLRLSTKRRWKEVNHGVWKRYEIHQIDPDQHLTMRIENVHDARKGRVGFEVGLTSKLHVRGRRAQWAKGVQVYSISADADAYVEMRLWCVVGMKLDVRKFPPDVVMVPEVTRAKLNVTDFRLQSISKFDGPVVRQLSKSIHRVLEDKLAEQRHKLPKKINREIEKNEDKMRLSLSNFASTKWNSLTSASKDDQDEASPMPKPALADRKWEANQPTLAEPTRTEPTLAEPVTQSRTQPISVEGEAGADLIDLLGPSKAETGKQDVGPVLSGPRS